MKVEDDFIQVDVVTSSGRTKSDVHMHAFPKKEVLARQLKPGGIPLNVALVMFDSTSAANFRRKMPNSLDYLKNNLNSLLMRGETIVLISLLHASITKHSTTITLPHSLFTYVTSSLLLTGRQQTGLYHAAGCVSLS